MNITFTTAEGFTLNSSEGTYVTDGGCEKYVYTIVVKKDGTAQCGPTVTRKEWALFDQVQSLVKNSEV